MAGSSFGKLFTVTTWGESHGKGIGVVVDGCPAGLPLCEEDIQVFLNRRKPGQSKFTTQRSESDAVEILSGVFEGKTTGTPISMVVWNENQRSKDYSEIASYYRPGHADYCLDSKYGFRDYRGGGRSSGRETIGRVAAGAIAIKLLNQMGIDFLTYSESIGPVKVDATRFDRNEIGNNNLYMPDAVAAKEASVYLEKCMEEKNSSGGVISCTVNGLPVGLGEPVFDKIDANLAKAMFSIGSVKGFEIGDGFGVATSTGLTNNDAFCICKNMTTNGIADGNQSTISNCTIQKASNHSGGTLGGMTDGAPLTMRVAIKPTLSIAATQKTVNKECEEIDIEITGRHDPVIVPRAVVVVEAMAAITILDALLENMKSKFSDVVDFYS
jgi:chorismate synthase